MTTYQVCKGNPYSQQQNIISRVHFLGLLFRVPRTHSPGLKFFKVREKTDAEEHERARREVEENWKGEDRALILPKETTLRFYRKLFRMAANSL